MSKNILFLYISYPDETKGGSNLYSEIVNEFVAKGHTVTVVAPSVNGEEGLITREKGFNLIRVKTMALFNTNPIKKGIANMRLSAQYSNTIHKYLGNNLSFDAVITSTPPITFNKLLKKFKKKGSDIYLILRDIFPQNARDLGMMNNRIIHSFFRKTEKELYALANHIGCMSQANVDYLIKHNPELDSSKLHLLPNWIALKNETSGAFEKAKQFTVIYGGNFGKPQDMEQVIRLAEKVESAGIKFLLVGKGTEFGKVQFLLKKYQLSNVTLKEYIPREEYLKMIESCHVGLISLNKNFTIPNFPSRVLGYWASKLAVFSITDRNTDIGEVVEEAKGGVAAYGDNLEDAAEKLIAMSKHSELCRQMGKNGYAYIQKHWTVETAYSTIMERLN